MPNGAIVKCGFMPQPRVTAADVDVDVDNDFAVDAAAVASMPMKKWTHFSLVLHMERMHSCQVKQPNVEKCISLCAIVDRSLQFHSHFNLHCPHTFDGYVLPKCS